MNRARRTLLAAAVVPLAAAAASSLTPLFLPHGQGGIGFDDLVFSSGLNRVLVPSGRTGLLNLVDPQTHIIESISGFSTEPHFKFGHGAGITSADFGHGFIFATDRSRQVVDIVDPVKLQVLGSAKLGAGPDYVRWVEPTSEVWVTEPSRKVIEYFKLEGGAAPKLVSAGTIPIPDGPESLVIDATRGRAYTNTRHNLTVPVDVKKHRDVARWPNGCAAARGIALDEVRGLLVVGCEEGTLTTLDVQRSGRLLASLATSGRGVNVLAYSPRLAHLYVPGGDSGTMAIVGVKHDGSLQALATVVTAPGADCVAADNLGQAYVCAPQEGKLLVFTDTLPAAK